jgi:hypothetical protein
VILRPGRAAAPSRRRRAACGGPARVSHALRLLRAHDLVRSERDGRMIRYELTDNSAMTAMLDNVLESAATYD